MQIRFSRMIRLVNNESGLALVSALMLGVIGMLLIASLMLMTDSGTLLSGAKKRYQMALDSAYGGMDFFTKEVIQRRLGGTTLATMGNYGGLLTPSIIDADFNTKLTRTGYIDDPAPLLPLPLYPTRPVPDAPDFTITFANFPSNPNIAVNTTILRTARGNSGTSSNVLQGGGVVNNNNGAVTPLHIPYLYQTQTVGQAAANPRENATLQSVYAY
ncbi:MAG: hypothetical protein ACI8ZB_000196 [Desulforhopalus sp.]|jgi:hypothetical protein